MQRTVKVWVVGCLAVLMAGRAVAQTPRVVPHSGVVRNAGGQTRAGTANLILALYAEAEGGTPLWTEGQTVTLDAQGRYRVALGATQPEGLPATVFANGEARWLGVTADGVEQPRVAVLSVPYALQAADAQTIGGKPLSAFVLAGSRSATDPSGLTYLDSAPQASAQAAPANTDAALIAGTPGTIAKFTNATDLGDSLLYDTGTKVGIGVTTPADALHVRFANTTGTMTGLAVQNMGGTATSYSGMLFYDQFGALGQFQGFNNSTHEYRINNIASGASINFMLGSTSRFQVASNGTIALPTTTAGGNGVLSIGGTRFMHGFQGNTYLGSGAGTFTSSASPLHLTGVGANALSSNTTGGDNTGVGYQALRLNTSGGGNTATGSGALTSNTTGSSNTANGWDALGVNVSGAYNTAVGESALYGNTADYNTGIGAFALLGSTTGNSNTAVGSAAAQSNGAANGNTAVGSFAMGSGVISGGANTAVGQLALQNLTSGANNSGVGQSALANLTTGSRNVALGQNALSALTAGNENTAIGQGALALVTSSDNTGLGKDALNNLVTGTDNVGIGVQAGGLLGSGSNNIYISSTGAVSESGTIRVGGSNQSATFVAGIFGSTVTSGATVLINSAGRLGTVVSSGRYKNDIQAMGDATKNLMRLRPVTFRYKQADADGSRPLQYGLVAEEVAAVYPELVVRGQQGEIESVQYHQLAPMLLNELQLQSQHAQQQDDTIKALQAQVLALQQQMERLLEHATR